MRHRLLDHDKTVVKKPVAQSKAPLILSLKSMDARRENRLRHQYRFWWFKLINSMLGTDSTTLEASS